MHNEPFVRGVTLAAKLFDHVKVSSAYRIRKNIYEVIDYDSDSDAEAGSD